MKKIVCIAALAFPLSGCSMVPTAVEMSVSSVFSGTVTSMARLANTSKHYDLTHPRIITSNICVDWNDRVASPDFVPTVQSELRRYKISSSIYPAGSETSDCDTVLYYSATRGWDTPMFGNGPTPYLAAAQLVLRQHGAIVAHAEYDEEVSPLGKWADTETKLRPVVQELIFGP